jgi:hypothetical protein
MGPVVVKARVSIGGRKELPGLDTGAVVPLGARPFGDSSLAEDRTSLPFSKRAPPKVAHFKMVWIK